MNNLREELRRTGRRRVLVLVVSSAIGLAFASSARAARQPAGTSDGAELFKTYCASCHGATGTGHGPAAGSLRHAPPDITLLAKNNGGMFPAARVRRIINGRDVDSHGDRDMPVWGDAFRPTREGRTSENAESRIAAIVRFLETIQQRQAH